jgi:hypothetical protein
VLGGEGKKASPGKASVLGARAPNLADAWARIHLARLCAALLLAEWTSAAEFAGGVGAPLLRMLVLLATRCGAPRALTPQPPSPRAPLAFWRTPDTWPRGAACLAIACLMAVLHAIIAAQHGHPMPSVVLQACRGWQ